MSDYDVDRYLETITRYSFTARTLTTQKALLDDIALTRSRGYAYVDSDRVEGLVGVSVPIFDRSGQVTAALTVGGPAVRAPDDPAQWAEPSKNAAHEISQALGYVGSPFGG
jgi:DNA-binding IclR family transcriptional regulator